MILIRLAVTEDMLWGCIVSVGGVWGHEKYSIILYEVNLPLISVVQAIMPPCIEYSDVYQSLNKLTLCFQSDSSVLPGDSYGLSLEQWSHPCCRGRLDQSRRVRGGSYY